MESTAMPSPSWEPHSADLQFQLSLLRLVSSGEASGGQADEIERLLSRAPLK